MTDPVIPPPTRAPLPGGQQLPPMPSGLAAIRTWVRTIQDLYSQGLIRSGELAEARNSAAAVANLHRTAAEITRAKAAMRSAAATEQMAQALATLEHGGQALIMLSRLQGALSDGPRRPLPGRVQALPATTEGA